MHVVAEHGLEAGRQHQVDARVPEEVRAQNRALMTRLVHACAAGGLLLALFLSFMLHPDPRGLGTHEQVFLPPCNFYSLTGLPCPFCGTTTAFTHMAQGELREAFFAQPLGAIGFVLCVVFVPIMIGAAISGKNAIGALTRLPWNKLSWILGACVLASWLFKLAMTILTN
jgi:hypothetical protein